VLVKNVNLKIEAARFGSLWNPDIYLASIRKMMASERVRTDGKN
jgi:hypothetical protein